MPPENNKLTNMTINWCILNKTIAFSKKMSKVAISYKYFWIFSLATKLHISLPLPPPPQFTQCLVLLNFFSEIRKIKVTSIFMNLVICMVLWQPKWQFYFFLSYDFIIKTCKSELQSQKSKQAMPSDCAHILQHIIEVHLKLVNLIKRQLMHIIWI